MIKRHGRRNIFLQQAVNQSFIEVHALVIPSALPVRLNPWPRYGQSIGIDTQIGNHLNILLPPVVVVAGIHSVAAIGNDAWLFAKFIPNGEAFAV